MYSVKLYAVLLVYMTVKTSSSLWLCRGLRLVGRARGSRGFARYPWVTSRMLSVRVEKRRQTQSASIYAEFRYFSLPGGHIL